ncbi:MAG: holo-ACP synthase [Sphingobacteriia bacterium]|nr:holo-ACP synthase [Sphingobacteriia bacterium]
MIIGIGTDIVEISRFINLLKKSTRESLKKIFTNNELEYVFSKKLVSQQAGILAKRYAAKEAFAKAIGTGVRQKIILNQIEIVNDDLGKPGIVLHKSTKEYTEKLFTKNISFHVSLSDEKKFAIAFVTIEKF